MVPLVLFPQLTECKGVPFTPRFGIWNESLVLLIATWFHEPPPNVQPPAGEVETLVFGLVVVPSSKLELAGMISLQFPSLRLLSSGGRVGFTSFSLLTTIYVTFG